MKTASFRAIRKYARGNISLDLIVAAAEKAGMKVTELGEDQIQLSSSMNLWSFGERLTVATGTVDGRRFIDISSKCALPTQIADWGKNERNVRKLFSEIDQLIGSEAEFEPCRLCADCGYVLVSSNAGTCPECGLAYSPHDAPHGQEQATWKNAAKLSVLLAAIEIPVFAGIFYWIFGNRFLNWFPLIAAFFLLANFGTIFLVIAIHGVVKRYMLKK